MRRFLLVLTLLPIFAHVTLITAVEGQRSVRSRLVGNSYRLDADLTEAYLRENDIMPDKALQAMAPYWEKLIVRWEKKAVHADARSGQTLVPYEVVSDDGKRMVYRVRNSNGVFESMTIVPAKDGYWQESKHLPGYREFFHNLEANEKVDPAAN